MKKFNLLVTAAATMLATSVFAQNTSDKWYIGIGAHATDHTSVRGIFDGYFDTRDYSFVPPLSKLTVARSIAKNFAVDLQASIGEVDNKRLNIKDEFFLLAGLGLRWTPLSESKSLKWLDPYVRVGANYHKYSYDGIKIDADHPYTSYDSDYKKTHDLRGKFTGHDNNFVLNGGVGINFWFTKNFGLNIESQYNWATAYSKDYADFFQHSASIIFKFGNNDRDKDGIPDKDDRCPDTPGLPQFQGCPDTDGDGIPDIDDQCPTVPGPVENNGCPWEDRDGDGVLDKDDRCPDTPGLVQFQGCPDTDGDGVPDPDDQCPTVPGPKENNGCPWPDRDGDGVPDKDDRCPDQPGPASNYGCPDHKTVETTLKDINFQFNSAKLTPESGSKIEAAAQLLNTGTLKESGAYIDGHTDRVGSEAVNMRISKQRAQSVVDALVKEGVSKDRLTARGFGKSQLKCTEADVKDGKYASQEECDHVNRRVEVLPRDLTIKKTVPVKAPAKKK
ncbi:OmpA family protein [Apibacter raozihei]|uniref:OmpA family protein n=1 Tax=Apibacter TaxID=1778601 RepID=UPI000FE2CC7A|nr:MULTISPECIES: OmpA family protein [Apibacter]